MASMIAEEMATASVSGEKPKAAKKARRAPQGGHVAKKKGSPAKRTPKGAKKAKPGRPGSSKTDKVLDLLKRPGGVTAKELMKVTRWQPHSVRGFLSGTIGKKMRLAVTSTKDDNGERTYSIKS
jgi:hypothetical protein